ncbi:MAG: serine/threonine protein kinase [Deltaproteobacteria bacterium]|nr:serine/threonine protein kinase [Deltaproteobacteria bacterium]MBW2210277.1 serine/threonine protein kinase [Deltaproteobacteria bacterium]MBW2213362.1 serine/threonine protein kinase [Deltaproteobacteria bacterium]MBW2378206.1 serine/threonine protein kinase [Deltaproteobacteria bacterium]MBW2549270.1 serine/threonine protein kinase [Deltaproteobacteria bacterium]
MTQEAATSDIPRPPVDLPVLGKFAGYDVLGRLALGGMAEILLTRHANTDGDHRFMVVKRILPHFEQDNDFVQMFLDEARIGMQLKHPNICQFHQFGADEGSHFIVMEWINGVPLGRMIRKARKTGGVGIPIAIRVGVDVARALHYAHIANDEHGEPFNIVHRDVSPHNVMIAYTGTVKLLDFGIAKADHRSHKTQAGVVKGKFAYMAPEQCTAGQADHRLDIFALGVCLFETLTGRSLYRRQTEAATMRAVIMDPVPSLKERLPDVADELDQILQKALAKEPGDRFATAEEFANELERFGRATKQIATQREVADFVRKVFPEEFTRGPRVDTVPFGASITLDMHHANDSASAKSYVSQIPGAIRELEIDGAGAGLDLGHLLDAPIVEQLPAPAADPAKPDPQPSGQTVQDPPKAIPNRAAPRKRSAGPKKPSGFGWKQVAMLLVLVLGGTAVAYDQTDIVKDGVARIESMFEDKGPPEVAVDDNPLLREHGARILVASSPPGATVFLDGKEQGLTPVALTGLMQGEYRVRVESPGFASWATKVQVSNGETAGVTAALLGKQGGAKPGAFGRVNIETTPPSDVYMAGDLIGRTPMETVYAPLGRVTFEFELTDGRKVSRQVSVRSDSIARARFDLSKPRR